jgi:hypothetical protein
MEYWARTEEIDGASLLSFKYDYWNEDEEKEEYDETCMLAHKIQRKAITVELYQDSCEQILFHRRANNESRLAF